MLPRISSIGLRRRAQGRPDRPPTRVDVVGADGQRELRELRTVERPVHLDRVDVVRDAAAPRPPASRRRSRWTAAATDMTRGSGANARMPPTASCRSRARSDERHAVGRRRAPHGQPRHREAGAARRARPRPRRPSRRSIGASAIASSPASRSARQASASEAAAGEREQVGQRKAGHRHTARERRRGAHGGNRRVERRRPADDAELARRTFRRERRPGRRRRGSRTRGRTSSRRRAVGGGPRRARDADGDQVAALEDVLRFAASIRDHAFHPCRIFCPDCVRLLRRRLAWSAIRFGHGRVNPSDGHLRVASMPILLP